MIPGFDEIIECPKCKALARCPTLVSGNTFGARLWTDGYMDAPMLPEAPPVTRCPKCNQFYWISAAQVLGTLDQSDAPAEWHEAAEIRELEADEYLECLEHKPAWGRRKMLELRILTWQKANDPFRANKHPEDATSCCEHAPAHRANMEQLMGLLPEKNPEDRLMKAELARELGLFDETLRLLEADFPDEALVPYADFIRLLALQRRSIVAEFP